MKRLILGLILIICLLVSVSCTKAPPPPQTPAPVPPPGINIPPPPTGTPTPPPAPAPTPTPSPAPILTPAPPRGPIYTDPGDTITTSVGDGFATGLHVVLRLGARWQVNYDEDMLAPVINDLYIDDDPANPGLGGTQYFRFRALKAGVTQIEYSLKHGTTGPVSEQKTFHIQIEGGQ